MAIVSKEKEISSGKKIVGFCFSLLGLLFFSLVWFILGFFSDFFPNLITIKDVAINSLNILKLNYFTILVTVISIETSFVICLLFGSIIHFTVNKNYYLKSFCKPFKIVNFIILPLFTYVMYKFCNFKFNTFINDSTINPIIISIITSIGVFLDSLENKKDIMSVMQKTINVISKTVVTVEFIGAKWFQKDQLNLGKLINNEINHNAIGNIIALVFIFVAIVLLLNSPFITTNLLFSTTNNDTTTKIKKKKK